MIATQGEAQKVTAKEIVMFDWYAQGVIARHKALIQEVEQYSMWREALQSKATAPGVRVRVLAGLGHWMVEHGHRLEASYEMSRAAGEPAEAC